MKLGELFIQLGVVGDTKPLAKALKQMKQAEGISKVRTKVEKQLGRHLKANEVNMIKNATAMANVVTNAFKVATAISGAVLALDRMAQSMIRTNQTFENFQQQTGMSIRQANRFVGAMGLMTGAKPENVLGDLTALSQRIYRLGLEGENSKIFQMLGFSPLGMQADEFLNNVRRVVKSKNLSEEATTYITDELGIGREWVGLLRSGDEFYNRMINDSRQLQLTEAERNKLYELGYENRLQWMKINLEYQRFLISVLPMINEALKTFVILVENAKKLEGYHIAIAALTTSWITNLKPVQKMFLSIYKIIAKIPVLGKAMLPFVKMLGIVGSRFLSILGVIMVIYDVIKGVIQFLNGQNNTWFAKFLNFIASFGDTDPNNSKKVQEDYAKSHPIMSRVIEAANVQMTNYFNNNPRPVSEINSQLESQYGNARTKFLSGGF